jgi:uncharacterized membrane protein YkvA (DUF1232 family)
MMDEIYDFVLRGGQRVTEEAIKAFQSKVPFLKVKAETLDAPEAPHLAGQILFLARYVEDVLDGVHVCGDRPAIAEAVFALGYVLRDVDIIPDSVHGMGYADDSAVIRAVLFSHVEEFCSFAEKFSVPLPPSEA